MYITGKVAKKKGYSQLAFELLAFITGIIALIVVLLINDKSAEPSMSRNSSADEILKYKQLLDQGIITEEEFQSKKKH